MKVVVVMVESHVHGCKAHEFSCSACLMTKRWGLAKREREAGGGTAWHNLHKCKPRPYCLSLALISLLRAPMISPRPQRP